MRLHAFCCVYQFQADNMYFKPSLNGLDPEEGQRVASNEVGKREVARGEENGKRTHDGAETGTGAETHDPSK
jgi:hypothetical protein